MVDLFAKDLSDKKDDVGKIALVTGSTNNMGKAIAEVLARKGYHDYCHQFKSFM
jgi:short-subunit dehydrogenase